MKIINTPSKADQWMYHYTSTKIALDYILPTGSIRLSPLARMNDPRESRDWTPIVCVEPFLQMDKDNWSALETRVAKALRHGVKLCCFASDDLRTLNPQDFSARSKRGYASAPMWHHYAGKHDGVCLMFDRDLLDTSFRSVVSSSRLRNGRIQYDDSGWINQLSNSPFAVSMVGVSNQDQFIARILHHFSEFWIPLYLTKLTDWAYEREYRWIYFDDDSFEPIYLPFGNALTGIVIGDCVDSRLTDEFYRYGVIHTAEVGWLRWNNGQPSIEHLTFPFQTHRHLLNPH